MTNNQCNLIVDSCCDLPLELIRTSNVKLLRFPYSIEDVEYEDDLFETITPHEFYDFMRKGSAPKTAQIPIPVYEKVFSDALKSGIPTVYLAFSSGLTGSFDTALTVYDRLKESYSDGELHLVDTKCASIAEGLLVCEAIRQRDNGLTAAELAKWVTEASRFTDSIFMVEDLEWLKRGGRINAFVAQAGSKLNVKPLLSIDADGHLVIIGLARGRKKAIKEMVEYYKSHSSSAKGNLLIAADADCPKDRMKLIDFIKKNDEMLPVIESNVGPVIGSHVGPDMLALTFWGYDKLDDMSIADRIARKIKSE